MHINTDLSSDAAVRNQSHRAATGATASQISFNPANGLDANQIDPSLQRLADFPAGIQDADREIQDEQGAGQAVDAARQWMSAQPETVLSAQANSLSEDVLGLLQPTE